VDRVLLTDRTGRSSIEGLPTLRFQSVSAAMTYKWRHAETLVAGITDWQPTMIAIPPPVHFAAGADDSTVKLLAVAMSVAPGRGARGVPLLSVIRSLLPSANTQRFTALSGG
jgi:hypothetical protein